MRPDPEEFEKFRRLACERQNDSSRIILSEWIQ